MSIQPQSVLIAVDFSDCSVNALEYVIQHVRLTKDDSLILMAIVLQPDASMAPSVRHDFDQVDAETSALNELKKLWAVTMQRLGLSHVSFRVDFVCETGNPKHVLVQWTSPTHGTSSSPHPPVSMLVVGSHGKTGTERELGSVSDYCMRQALCPVMVIKDPTHVEQLKKKTTF